MQDLKSNQVLSINEILASQSDKLHSALRQSCILHTQLVLQVVSTCPGHLLFVVDLLRLPMAPGGNSEMYSFSATSLTAICSERVSAFQDFVSSSIVGNGEFEVCSMTDIEYCKGRSSFVEIGIYSLVESLLQAPESWSTEVSGGHPWRDTPFKFVPRYLTC